MSTPQGEPRTWRTCHCEEYGDVMSKSEAEEDCAYVTFDNIDLVKDHFNHQITVINEQIKPLQDMNEREGLSVDEVIRLDFYHKQRYLLEADLDAKQSQIRATFYGHCLDDRLERWIPDKDPDDRDVDGKDRYMEGQDMEISS